MSPYAAAGNTASYRTCAATNRGFGAFDVDRPQLLDNTVFNLLHCSDFGTAIALTGLGRCTSGEHDLAKQQE
jgi:hypothetical protein